MVGSVLSQWYEACCFFKFFLLWSLSGRWRVFGSWVGGEGLGINVSRMGVEGQRRKGLGLKFNGGIEVRCSRLTYYVLF